MESKKLILIWTMIMVARIVAYSHDYGDALRKSILFFEGQRSGKLPPSQRMTWRKDSALRDGFEFGVDLTGGYYDAGDNVKFNFPMAFTTTMLAWSVLEFGGYMGEEEHEHALDAIRWGTDYFLKCTSVPGFVFAMVGDPRGDHDCWERPEDMDTPRTPYAVSKQFPGSEVSAEIAAALASSSIVFRDVDPLYSKLLLGRASMVYKFADNYRGSYNDYLGPWVCPFYCNFGGYMDELVWGAAWLYKATNSPHYWGSVIRNYIMLESKNGGNFAEFGWDTKNAGINVLVSKIVMKNDFNKSLSSHFVRSVSSRFVYNSDKFVCSILPESPTKSVNYSQGGLIFKHGGSNMQHTTSLSFLLLAYADYLETSNRYVQCGPFNVSPTRLRKIVKGQVDYVLGSNPLNMSYMVGYGEKFPQRIHHRAASVPSMDQYPEKMGCQDGTPYFNSDQPNQNLLIGALTGGPAIDDSYEDDRSKFVQSEPTTYLNAPFVGVLAYFKGHPW